MAARAEVVAADDLGAGPVVLLIHGVAFGPAALATVGRALAADTRVLIVHRRGYGASRAMAPSRGVEDHARDAVDLLDARGIDRAAVVGVSGGATIAVALTAAHPHRVPVAVVHEPVLGPLAPGVHGLVCGIAWRMRTAPSAPAAAEVAAMTLAGPETWGSLGPRARADVRRSAAAVCHEVPQFARYTPDRADLEALRAIPVVATVGAESGPERREAAGVMRDLAGARVVTVDGSGHLVQVDAPAAFADLIRRAMAGAPA